MKVENIAKDWPVTDGQLKMAELLEQAGPTRDQLRTEAVLRGWIRFVEANVEAILWLGSKRFEDKVNLFFDAEAELNTLIRQSVDAHLSRKQFYEVVEQTFIAGGADEKTARIARQNLMEYIAPIKERIISTPRKKL